MHTVGQCLMGSVEFVAGFPRLVPAVYVGWDVSMVLSLYPPCPPLIYPCVMYDVYGTGVTDRKGAGVYNSAMEEVGVASSMLMVKNMFAAVHILLAVARALMSTLAALQLLGSSLIPLP